jgi:3-dehydroshikimate dehydratase
MPYRLSAFADEISPDIQIQMDNLIENDIKLCGMRGANGKNVMEFEDFQVNLMKTQFFNRGIRFSCIGSPIGKIKITDPMAPEIERFKKAVKLARAFETKVIRVFTFFVPPGEASKHQAEVLKRMKEIADCAKAEGVNLVIENEKDLYGDIADRQLEVIEHINAPHVKAAFDFANFVQCDDDCMAAWQKLKKYVVDIHVKDCRASDKREVPAGQGAGKIPEILKDAFSTGWAGYLTFEPHLSESGTFKGFTGPVLFKTAVESLRKILVDVGAK